MCPYKLGCQQGTQNHYWNARAVTHGRTCSYNSTVNSLDHRSLFEYVDSCVDASCCKPSIKSTRTTLYFRTIAPNRVAVSRTSVAFRRNASQVLSLQRRRPNIIRVTTHGAQYATVSSTTNLLLAATAHIYQATRDVIATRASAVCLKSSRE